MITAKIAESAKRISHKSTIVSIDQRKIDEFCSEFEHTQTKHWIAEGPINLKELSEEELLKFLIIFNSISFCYWGEPKWSIEYKGETIDGAYGMIGALKKAIEKNCRILDFNHLAKIEKEEFADILKGSNTIPLLEERWMFIRQVGQVMITKYQGKAANLVKKADKDVNLLLKEIITNFPLFEDKSEYAGEEAYFYKRAQLLISDIYQGFKGEGPGDFGNIGQLTACADYKLPQMLRKFGILKYGSDLAKKIDNKKEIKKDSQEEVEIRANTIQAVEMIKERLKKKIPDIDSIHINDYLWLLSQDKKEQDKPYHLTRTTAY